MRVLVHRRRAISRFWRPFTGQTVARQVAGCTAGVTRRGRGPTFHNISLPQRCLLLLLLLLLTLWRLLHLRVLALLLILRLQLLAWLAWLYRLVHLLRPLSLRVATATFLCRLVLLGMRLLLGFLSLFFARFAFLFLGKGLFIGLFLQTRAEWLRLLEPRPLGNKRHIDIRTNMRIVKQDCSYDTNTNTHL
jgi:hypothetical protein